jgi:hypothetical protein
MSPKFRRRTCLFAISSLACATAACSGPDTGDCHSTATCAADSPDASAIGNPASEAGSQAAADAADDHAFVRVDATSDGSSDAGDGAADTDAGDARTGVGGCVSNDNCGPGTVCAEDGVCVPGCTEAHACPSGQSCCDSACVDMRTDSAHCGGCDIACAAANGTAKCDQGTCTVAACSTGFIDCNHFYADGCETPDPGPPKAPLPMTPSIGTYTGSVHAASSMKPTFSWQPVAAPGTCKITYQIQMDARCALPEIESCTFASPAVDVSDIAAPSFTPQTALAVSSTPPVGARYYWRVRACDEQKRCSAWSKVRYANVGRLSDDFDGDGYSDLIVEHSTGPGAGQGLYFDVCSGGSPLNGLPDHQIPGVSGATPSSPGSRYFAYVGDVNADGFADFAAGSPSENKVRLFLGGPIVTRLSSPSQELAGDVADSGYGASVSAGGDVNGDGFDDLLVGAPDPTNNAGRARAYVYLGSSQFTTGRPVRIALGGDVATFGAEVRGVGDMDQDGYADFVVSDGSGHLYRGSRILSDTAVRTFPEVVFLARAGDLNGDGFDDAAFAYVGSHATNSTVSVVWGGASLVSAEIQKLFDVSSGLTDLVGGGDMNADGLSDLLVGVPVQERVIVVRGAKPFAAATTLGDFAAFLAPGSTTDSMFGRALAFGDYDGDGAHDAAISVSTDAADPSHSGAVWLVPGSQLLAAFDPGKSVRSVPLSTATAYSYAALIAH